MTSQHEPPAPSFETERLTLRPHTLDDFADSAALWGDPEVTRYIGGKPSTLEDSWGRVLRAAGHWALLGYGFWAVREKGSGRYVGEVGIFEGRRGLGPSFDGAPEVGWVISPSAQGRGFATEAVVAALAWSERRFGPIRLVCMIAPENAPSIRLAAKCGFREITRTTYKGEPTVLFERTP